MGQRATTCGRVLAAFLLSGLRGGLAAEAPAQGGELLKAVRAYADAMLEHGRDTYGAEHSPLFAEALDRKTFKLLEGDALKKAAGISRAAWGIRPGDRMLAGGNPQHCQNLYQALYALTQATGEAKYAAEADESLKWFLEHCQSPATGLFCWGEHAGWGFLTEKRLATSQGNTHEFYRPWVLWDRCWELAPEPCRKFALGLWEHQIGDQKAGDYSRHAAIDRHGPGTEAPYARHGGFYIETWAVAYAKSKDPVFLKAIESVAGALEAARRDQGMLVSGSKKKGGRTFSDISLAISLWNAAASVPDDLAERLRAQARANDEAFAKARAAAKPQPTLDPVKANLWSSGYGGSGGEVAGRANVAMLRWRQVKLDAYRGLVLDSAARYLDGEIGLGYPVHPGTVGKAIVLMLNAHELTGEEKWLTRADHLAKEAVRLLVGDGCPLPRAAHCYDHYEAATDADTLMMALLQLWAARQKPAVELPLTYCDR
ncbi:MAG TPA: hypothetical protein VNE39_26880 [Planctomycetota bacterium]|nr:hypothetical protein [Planctomycetota bacterium]